MDIIVVAALSTTANASPTLVHLVEHGGRQRSIVINPDAVYDDDLVRSMDKYKCHTLSGPTCALTQRSKDGYLNMLNQLPTNINDVLDDIIRKQARSTAQSSLFDDPSRPRVDENDGKLTFFDKQKRKEEANAKARAAAKKLQIEKRQQAPQEQNLQQAKKDEVPIVVINGDSLDPAHLAKLLKGVTSSPAYVKLHEANAQGLSQDMEKQLAALANQLLGEIKSEVADLGEGGVEVDLDFGEDELDDDDDDTERKQRRQNGAHRSKRRKGRVFSQTKKTPSGPAGAHINLDLLKNLRPSGLTGPDKQRAAALLRELQNVDVDMILTQPPEEAQAHMQVMKQLLRAQNPQVPEAMLDAQVKEMYELSKKVTKNLVQAFQEGAAKEGAKTTSNAASSSSTSSASISSSSTARQPSSIANQVKFKRRQGKRTGAKP